MYIMNIVSMGVGSLQCVRCRNEQQTPVTQQYLRVQQCHSKHMSEHASTVEFILTETPWTYSSELYCSSIVERAAETGS
jgi:hypothetical protein